MANNNTCPQCGGSGTVNTGNGASLCPVCDGSGKQYIPGIFFVYGTQIQLAANQALTNLPINILDAPFKTILLTQSSTGSFTVLFRDGKNKRPFMNTQLHRDLVFGTAQNPFPVLVPYVFEWRSNILIDITDVSGAPNTVWLGFCGTEQTGTGSSGVGTGS
jgi:hypothetical protein